MGAAVVAGAGFIVGYNSTDAIGPATSPEKWDAETDVVVVGGGNGGLSAAAAAVEEGKKAILVEISAFIGGGSAYSGGTIHAWGCETWEEYKAHTENLHDPVMAKKYIETFRQVYLPWLQKIGVPLTRHKPGGKGFNKDWQLGSGEAGFLKHKAYFDALKKFVESKGGTVMTQTRVLRLVIDDAGTVCGVQAVKEGATPIFIKASKVILATGGFQSNKGLLAKYVGPNGDTLRNMGTPYNTGSGMLMAQGVGAKKDLLEESDKGLFREDLFFRISTFIVELPALRERREDIRLLAEEFIAKFSRKYQLHELNIDTEFISALEIYQWRGNVRELEHSIERAVIMLGAGQRLLLEHLSKKIQESYQHHITKGLVEDIIERCPKKQGMLTLAEGLIIDHVLKSVGGNVSAAAEKLGVTRRTIYNKLQEYPDLRIVR